MEQRRPPEGLETALKQSRAAAMKLARSSDGKKLMELLQAQGDQVRRAAQEAARGDPGQLMAIVDQLARTREGADLLARMDAQAKQAGLE